MILNESSLRGTKQSPIGRAALYARPVQFAIASFLAMKVK